jgi:hypothetical protein
MIQNGIAVTFAAALFWAALLALGVDESVDLSGTWLLDKSRSDAPRMGREGLGGGLPGTGFPGHRGGGIPGGGRPGGRVLGDVTLVVEQTPQELKLTRTIAVDGNQQSFTQTFAMDGSESINPTPRGEGESRSNAAWKKQKLVIEGTQKVATPRGEMEVGFREEFSLADDGRSLVLETTRSTPKGQMSMKQVFTKQ